MNTLVIEHVPIADLPEEWRARFGQSVDGTVTVRIEEEPTPSAADEYVTDDPAFGIWRDRDDMNDVEASIRALRRPRYDHEGRRIRP